MRSTGTPSRRMSLESATTSAGTVLCEASHTSALPAGILKPFPHQGDGTITVLYFKRPHQA